jgi:hypothetical protein
MMGQEPPIEPQHIDNNAADRSDEEGNRKEDQLDEDVAQGYQVL